MKISIKKSTLIQYHLRDLKKVTKWGNPKSDKNIQHTG